jgi:glycosyltransferase involved in cell wall biosynthesis
MDGSSKDGTVEMLRELAAQDPRLLYVSEPDKGEVDAINKGLKIARGSIVGFHASDEYYTPGAISAAVDFLVKNPQFAGVSGDALFIDEHGRELNRGMITYRGRMCRATIKRIIAMRHNTSPLVHGSFFGWAEKIARNGPFDLNYSVIPDFDFYLRLLDSGEQIGCLPRVQIYYTLHSDMGAEKYWARVQKQLRALRQRYGWTAADEIVRRTLGRAASYFSNPYRSPFLKGAFREMAQWRRRRAFSPEKQ